MQSDIILYEKIIALIPEFKNKLTYLNYFVAYERPVYQRTLYEFWCKTLDTLTEKILKLSVYSFPELDQLFKQFEYKPLGLRNILLNMKKEKLIITQNIMDEAVKIVFNGEQPPSLENNDQSIFWNPIKKMVQNIWHQNSHEFKPVEQLLHVKYFQENVIRFKQAIEKLSLDTFNTFTILQLQNELELPKREIQFLIKVFQKAQLIQFVGNFKLNKLKQEVFIYKSLWQVEANNMELTKHQTQFKLQCKLFPQIDYEQKMYEDRDDYYNQIDLQQEIIKKKINEKRSDKEIKFHIAFVIQYKKLVEKIQQKLMIIRQNQITLNNAETDLPLQDIIGKVNETLKQLECDPFIMKENLDELNSKQQEQQEVQNLMKMYTDDGVDELFNQYLEEMNLISSQKVIEIPLPKQQPQQLKKQDLLIEQLN